MHHQYRLQLPPTIQTLVDKIEGAIGQEIEVRNDPGMGAYALASAAQGSITFRGEMNTADALHELLHLKRQLVDGVPRAHFKGATILAPNGAPSDRASIERNSGPFDFDAHLEHLAIYGTMRSYGYPQDLHTHRCYMERLDQWKAGLSRKVVGFGTYVILMRHGSEEDRALAAGRMLECGLLDEARTLDAALQRSRTKVRQIEAFYRALGRPQIELMFFHGIGVSEVMSLAAALEREN